jgi:hypothetical protein
MPTHLLNAIAHFQAQASITRQDFDMEKLCLLALLTPLLHVIDKLLSQAMYIPN